MSKLVPLDITVYSNIEDIIRACYVEFKATFFSRDITPKLKGREIYFSFHFLENIADIFWHSASIRQKRNLNILPCTNSSEMARCDDNCLTGKDSIMLKGSVRAKCIYRAARTVWITPIINMCNAGDSRVMYWEKSHSNAKQKRLYVRYKEEENDYLLVFEEKGEKSVMFITAFPVFFTSAKKDYSRDYIEYTKKSR